MHIKSANVLEGSAGSYHWAVDPALNAYFMALAARLRTAEALTGPPSLLNAPRLFARRSHRGSDVLDAGGEVDQDHPQSR